MNDPVKINIQNDGPWTFTLPEGVKFEDLHMPQPYQKPVLDSLSVTAQKSKGMTTQEFMRLYQNDAGTTTGRTPSRQSVAKVEYYETERKKLSVVDCRKKYLRYGKDWEELEMGDLQHYFAKCLTLDEICDRMQRPPEGVAAKLEKLGYIKPVAVSYRNAITPRGHRVRREFAERFDHPFAKLDFSHLEIRAASQLLEDPMPCTTIFTPTKYRNPTEETTMSIFNMKPIEVKTFIFGTDSKNVSDETIYGYIKQLEDEIVRLEAIKAKPAKLKARIAELQASIDELVKFVDAR